MGTVNRVVSPCDGNKQFFSLTHFNGSVPAHSESETTSSVALVVDSGSGCIRTLIQNVVCQ